MSIPVGTRLFYEDFQGCAIPVSILLDDYCREELWKAIMHAPSHEEEKIRRCTSQVGKWFTGTTEPGPIPTNSSSTLKRQLKLRQPKKNKEKMENAINTLEADKFLLETYIGKERIIAFFPNKESRSTQNQAYFNRQIDNITTTIINYHFPRASLEVEKLIKKDAQRKALRTQLQIKETELGRLKRETKLLWQKDKENSSKLKVLSPSLSYKEKAIISQTGSEFRLEILKLRNEQSLLQNEIEFLRMAIYSRVQEITKNYEREILEVVLNKSVMTL